MRYQITIDIPDELVAVLDQLRARGSDPPPARPDRTPPPTVRPHREAGDDDEPYEETRAAGPGGPDDGPSLYHWAKDHNVLKRVQAIGKRHDLDWRVSDWTPQQAVAVYRELMASRWGGGERRAQ